MKRRLAPRVEHNRKRDDGHREEARPRRRRARLRARVRVLARGRTRCAPHHERATGETQRPPPRILSWHVLRERPCRAASWVSTEAPPPGQRSSSSLPTRSASPRRATGFAVAPTRSACSRPSSCCPTRFPRSPRRAAVPTARSSSTRCRMRDRRRRSPQRSAPRVAARARCRCSPGAKTCCPSGSSPSGVSLRRRGDDRHERRFPLRARTRGRSPARRDRGYRRRPRARRPRRG